MSEYAFSFDPTLRTGNQLQYLREAGVAVPDTLDDYPHEGEPGEYTACLEPIPDEVTSLTQCRNLIERLGPRCINYWHAGPYEMLGFARSHLALFKKPHDKGGLDAIIGLGADRPTYLTKTNRTSGTEFGEMKERFLPGLKIRGVSLLVVRKPV